MRPLWLFFRLAFITGPDGAGMTDLGSLDGGYSHASGINDAGQVVGMSTINDAGQVVGGLKRPQAASTLSSPAPMAWA